MSVFLSCAIDEDMIKLFSLLYLEINDSVEKLGLILIIQIYFRAGSGPVMRSYSALGSRIRFGLGTGKIATDGGNRPVR